MYHPDAEITPSPSSRFLLRIGAATFSRLVLSTARRFIYPFAPAISRGLGVPLTSITRLIAINQATGILGVFIGPLTDRIGYRSMMQLGLGMLVAGMLAAGAVPLYGSVLIAMFLAGMGKSIFDPALQAYVGERVPFKHRGLVVGILEVSWAGSSLLGIPLIGLLIDRLGWRAPFWALGSLGLIGLLAMTLLIPRETRQEATVSGTRAILLAWQHMLRARQAVGFLGFSFLMSAANDNLFVVYGAWLETSFDLGVLALGAGTSLIGAAELLGEGLTASLADRMGLKRAIIAGLILTAAGYLLLPLAGQALWAALGGLFLVFLAFEFAIVSALSLCTELLPGQRATMMAGYLAAAGAGRVAGALTGGSIWLAGGMAATAWVSASFTGLSLIALLWGLHDWSN